MKPNLLCYKAFVFDRGFGIRRSDNRHLLVEVW